MKRLMLLLVCWTGLLAVHIALAQTTTAYKVQAVYIYNFTKYANWKSTDDNFYIGVYGNSDILAELQQVLKDKVVGVKPIVVKTLAQLNEATNCDIVYVAQNKNADMVQVAEKIKSKGILLIGEDAESTKKGAAISFVLVGGKMKFKINQKALQEAGLQVSDALLTLGIVE